MAIPPLIGVCFCQEIENSCMPLYQNSVLKKYLKQQDKDAVVKAFKKFAKYFHDPKIQENIRASKEEEYQGIFLTELFSKILGYTMKPNANFDLVAEHKNEKNSKKADGAILKDNQALGVIELKGTNTKDLEKVRQQAFDYKANQTGCVYVITSNFEKIRFYINNAVDFEEFDLFRLNQERFELLYLCLAKDNLLSNVPLKIKEASVQEEEAITKKFYKDYATFKRELFRDLVKLNMKNEAFRTELNNADIDRGTKNIKQALFKKSQKLIDRFLFIFFAEDRGLLPPNSTVKILDQWDKLKELDEHVPLYNRFKKYFNYLDTGRKGTDKTAEIFAYNGGLFRPDGILDSLLISDELLYKHTKDLQTYDFDSQVDVNILGHIFENSLNEIESVNAEIEGTDFDKQKTKRKKDGVFYTPKYITKYIVDNTVGKLCSEKKAALKIIEEDFHPKRQKETKKKLLGFLESYRKWLLQLTILDPACGSGAFLNQALDFLIKEHEYIDELQTKLLGGGLVFPNIETTVLENNIYGVDLNEESVEIAKLSLWLRTAQPRRKLNDLSSNIKCGNSLIDSKTVVGDKAFKWEKEYPHIFKKGGFDIVIGNPPYVRVQNLDYATIDFYKTEYQVCHQRVDLYLLFFEKGYDILNKKGLLSFVNPTMFVNSDYGIGLRKFLKNTGIKEIVDFGDLAIFADAITYTGIFTITKEIKKDFDYVKFNDLSNLSTVLSSQPRTKIEIAGLSDDGWTYSSKKELKLLSKLNTKLKLSDIAVINSGCFTGLDDSFFVNDDDIEKFNLEKELIFPVIMGKEPKRYSLNPPVKKSIYPYINKEGKTELIEEDVLEKNYPNIHSYLQVNKERLLHRKDSRKTFKEMGRPWYSYTRKGLIDVFEKDKILVGYIVNDNTYCLDENNYMFSVGRVFGIVPYNKELKFGLLGLLNSKISSYLMKLKCPIKQGGYFKISSKYLSDFDILSEENLISLTDIVKSQIGQNNNYNNLIDKLNKLLEYNFKIIISQKLQNWHELEFGDFIKELNKAIKKAGGEKLSKMDEMEWMEVFETKKAEAQTLKAEIDKTDAAIDQMVYELYGLTEEEIQIVENN